MTVPLSAYRQLLSTYLRPQWRRALLVGTLLLISIALQLAGPQLLRAFVDQATAGAALGQLVRLALLFMGLALVQQALVVATTYHAETLGWTATNELRADLASHCLRLDLGFHKRRTPGELIERIDGDVTAIATFFSQFVVQIVGSLILLLGILVFLWREDWRAGAAMAVFALIALLTMVRLRVIALPYWAAHRQASAELFGFLEERLGGTEDIRANGGPPYVMRRLYERTRQRLSTGRRARVMSAIPWSVPSVFAVVGIGTSFAIGAYLHAAGQITIGTAFLIYFYARLLLRPLDHITHQIEDFQKASAGIARVTQLRATPSTLRDGPGAALPAGALSVDFDNVSFGYGEEEHVLEGVSFRLAPGEVLGLLGRTGSGKTTIARLLFRLYDPAVGAIRLGGAASSGEATASSGEAAASSGEAAASSGEAIDLRAARLDELRGRIAMVTQDVQLFRATVRENLTFFDRSVSDQQIEAGLAELGLLEWVRALPRGLDTMLGPAGAGLSAGEAQLLAFARAFLRQPGLVVLDEASSRLDPATERLIERAVGRLLEGRTAIVIAHRLETIERCDRVMVLEDGRVVELGRRAALAADPGSRLAALLRAGQAAVLV